jgi:hypothetical protein
MAVGQNLFIRASGERLAFTMLLAASEPVISVEASACSFDVSLIISK